MNHIKTLLITVLISLLCSCFMESTENRLEDDFVINHAVTFEHRGSKTNKPQKGNLFQVAAISNKKINANGLLIKGAQDAFYMDVVSVFCGEDVCRIDPVRLYWNELGRYQRFALKPKVTLEKGNGEGFESEDYIKLQKVLRNLNSGLGEYYKDELINTKGSANTVDALSGATVAMLKTDYIEGAVWTCYTLWHFANQELPHIIRNITGEQYTLSELQNIIQNGELEYKLFAIEQLTRRHFIDEHSIELVIKQSQIKNRMLDLAIIDYVEQLPTQPYYESMLDIIAEKNSSLHLLALTSLLNTENTIPANFYGTLSDQVVSFDSYQNIRLLQTIIKNKKVSNNEIISSFITLLQHDNFVIARSVYWFLAEQKLSPQQNELMNTFYQKNNHKL